MTHCGTVLTPSMLQLDNDTSSPAYFGTNQTAALLFSHVRRLKVVNIQVSDYYGFAIIVANSIGLIMCMYLIHLVVACVRICNLNGEITLVMVQEC